MLKFKKVVERGNGTANLNEDQKKYEQKVVELEKACRKFDSEFKKILDTPEKWKKKFNDCFNDQMKKNKLTSRTSRVLHGISKNLSKFKGKFEDENVDDYVKAFEFTPEKVKNGYIKRSAIDDKAIANFFNFDIPTILMKKSNELKVKDLRYTLQEIESPLKESEKALEDLEEKMKIVDKDIKYYSEYLKKTPKDENTNDYATTEKVLRNLKSTKRSLIYSKSEVEKYRKKLISTENKKSSRDYVSKMVKELEEKMGILNKNVEDASKVMKDAEAKGDGKKSGDNNGVFVFKSEADFKNIYNDHKKSDIVKVVIGGKIQKISEKVFMGCNNLVSVTLSKGCTEICNSAFSSCSSLKVIDTTNVTTIGDYAFSGCSSLQIISLKNVKKIGAHAFSGCSELLGPLTGTLDTGKVTTIGDYAFNGCEKLKGIDLGNVTTIGEYVFSGCSALVGTGTGALNTEKVTTIGTRAFAGCNNLTKINLENVTNIGESAFLGCGNLTGVADQEGILNTGKLTGIEANAFNGCSKLKGINLKSIERPMSIGDFAFKDCSEIKIILLSKDINKETIESIRDVMVGQKQIAKKQGFISGMVSWITGNEDPNKGIEFRLV